VTDSRSLGLLGAGVGLALAVGMLTAPPGDAAAPAVPLAAAAPAGVPLPTLTRPPAGVHGHPLWDSWHELRSFGYRQREYQGLYPTFDRYQRLMERATNRAVRHGWLLRPDARVMMRRVCAVQPRYPADIRGTCRAATYDPPRFASTR